MQVGGEAALAGRGRSLGAEVDEFDAGDEGDRLLGDPGADGVQRDGGADLADGVLGGLDALEAVQHEDGGEGGEADDGHQDEHEQPGPQADRASAALLGKVRHLERIGVLHRFPEGISGPAAPPDPFGAARSASPRWMTVDCVEGPQEAHSTHRIF